MYKTTFYISGMDCPAEEKLISEKLRSIPHVKQLEFNLIQQELIVIHQESDISEIQKALNSLGMEFQIKNDSFTTTQLNLLQPHITSKDWMIIIFSGVLAFSAEVLAFTTHFEKSPLIIMLALASMLVGGRGTFIKGLRSIKYFTINIIMNFIYFNI